MAMNESEEKAMASSKRTLTYRGHKYRKVSKIVSPIKEEDSGIRTAATTGDKEQELIQWRDQGNLMSPMGKIVLTPKLKPGVYTVAQTMNGIAFERQAITTDALLRFEDPVHTKILGEMDNFWAKKEKFEKKAVLHNRAILMYGPPGSGKSCLIKLAIEDLINKGDVVFTTDRYIGGLVEGIKVFREIEPDRRCLAILEDVDEMNEHTLLQLLDGTNTANNIVYLATTNYVGRLPPRVLRAGRFGRKIEVPFPPAAGRRAYLKDKASDEGLTPEQMEDLVKKTAGFSFGSLKELIISVFCMGQPLEEVLKRLRGSGLEDNPSPEPYEGEAIAPESNPPDYYEEPVYDKAEPLKSASKEALEDKGRLITFEDLKKWTKDHT